MAGGVDLASTEHDSHTSLSLGMGRYPDGIGGFGQSGTGAGRISTSVFWRHHHHRFCGPAILSRPSRSGAIRGFSVLAGVRPGIACRATPRSALGGRPAVDRRSPVGALGMATTHGVGSPSRFCVTFGEQNSPALREITHQATVGCGSKCWASPIV